MVYMQVMNEFAACHYRLNTTLEDIRWKNERNIAIFPDFQPGPIPPNAHRLTKDSFEDPMRYSRPDFKSGKEHVAFMQANKNRIGIDARWTENLISEEAMIADKRGVTGRKRGPYSKQPKPPQPKSDKRVYDPNELNDAKRARLLAYALKMCSPNTPLTVAQFKAAIDLLPDMQDYKEKYLNHNRNNRNKGWTDRCAKLIDRKHWRRAEFKKKSTHRKNQRIKDQIKDMTESYNGTRGASCRYIAMKLCAQGNPISKDAISKLRRLKVRDGGIELRASKCAKGFQLKWYVVCGFESHSGIRSEN